MPPPRNTIRKPMLLLLAQPTKNRLAAGHERTPTPSSRGRTHQPLGAVSGDSIPIAGNASDERLFRQCIAAVARGISAPRWRMTFAARLCAAPAASAGRLPDRRAAI